MCVAEARDNFVPFPQGTICQGEPRGDCITKTTECGSAPCATCRPFEPSRRAPVKLASQTLSQWAAWEDMHGLQRPHEWYERMTWSPGSTVVTTSPTR